MDVSCAFPPGPEAPRLARLAEGLGYRRAWRYDPAAARPEGFAPPRLVAASGPTGLAAARVHGDGVMCIGAPPPEAAGLGGG